MGFVTCGPNEVLVVSGFGHHRPKYVLGGRVFIWPKLQKVQRLSIGLMTLSPKSKGVKTKDGVAINVTSTAQVKVYPGNQSMLDAACETLLTKSEEEISKGVQKTIEGHQSSTIATMTAEEVYVNRKEFSKSLYELCAADLINMGLYVVSYTVNDITDDEGFYRALGRKQAEEASKESEGNSSAS